jgi:hypothetical protein
MGWRRKEDTTKRKEGKEGQEMLTQYGRAGMRTTRDDWHPLGPQTPGRRLWCEPLLRSGLVSVCLFSPFRFLLPLHRPAYKLHESGLFLAALLAHSDRTDYFLYYCIYCTSVRRQKWKHWKNLKQKPTHGPRYTHTHHCRGRCGHYGVPSVPETRQPSGPSTIDRHQMPPNGNSHVRSAGI